jgi:2-haloacid dehalogenase
MTQQALPKALAFDVFGTVVDWRTSIARESAAFLAAINCSDIDPAAFTDAWRFRYISTMAAFKESGGHEFESCSRHQLLPLHYREY